MSDPVPTRVTPVTEGPSADLTTAFERLMFLLGRDRDRPHHHVAHVWTAHQTPDDPVVIGTVVQEDLPWVGAKMSRNEDVVVDWVPDMPPETRTRPRTCSPSDRLFWRS